MKRPPKIVELSPFLRNYGIAYSWLIREPVWRRSRNITQMLGVMPETASASVVDGRTYKSGVTCSKAKPSGGSAAASIQSKSSVGVR